MLQHSIIRGTREGSVALSTVSSDHRFAFCSVHLDGHRGHDPTAPHAPRAPASAAPARAPSGLSSNRGDWHPPARRQSPHMRIPWTVATDEYFSGRHSRQSSSQAHSLICSFSGVETILSLSSASSGCESFVRWTWYSMSIGCAGAALTRGPVSLLCFRCRRPRMTQRAGLVGHCAQGRVAMLALLPSCSESSVNWFPLRNG